MRFEDHLFIKLTHAHGFTFAVSKKNTIEAAVRNGSGVENGEACGAITRCDDVADTVPGEARTKLSEFVGGIPAAEQIENSFKG